MNLTQTSTSGVDTLRPLAAAPHEVLQTLTILEMRDSAPVRDVATVMQLHG